MVFSDFHSKMAVKNLYLQPTNGIYFYPDNQLTESDFRVTSICKGETHGLEAT